MPAGGGRKLSAFGGSKYEGMPSGMLWKLDYGMDVQNMSLQSWRCRFFDTVQDGGTLSFQYLSDRNRTTPQIVAVLHGPAEDCASLAEMEAVSMEQLSEEAAQQVCHQWHSYCISITKSDHHFEDKYAEDVFAILNNQGGPKNDK